MSKNKLLFLLLIAKFITGKAINKIFTYGGERRGKSVGHSVFKFRILQ